MAEGRIVDLAGVIERQTIGRFQILLGSLLLMCMFVDGFEAQAPGFAAPALIRDFGINRGDMRWVFAAGNLGLMAGAIALGILGDRVGRSWSALKLIRNQ